MAKQEGQKSYFLIFDTKYTAHIEMRDVIDGKALISDKFYFVDQTRPLYLKVSSGVFGMAKRYYPLYIVKWNSVLPYNIAKDMMTKGMPDATKLLLEKYKYNIDKMPEDVKAQIVEYFKGGVKSISKDDAVAVATGVATTATTATANDNNNGKKNDEQYIPDFSEFGDDKSPEYVAKLVDLKIVGNLMGKKTEINFLLIAGAVILGIIITYMLIYTKVIQLPK